MTTRCDCDDFSCEYGEGVLRSHGLKVTSQRAAILMLYCGDAGHWTAQQVFAALEDSPMSMSVATVYNTLETFEDVGLLRRFTTPDGQTVFDRNVEPHHHAICASCARIFDVVVPDDAISALLESTVEHLEFDLVGASVWFRGRCERCRHRSIVQTPTPG